MLQSTSKNKSVSGIKVVSVNTLHPPELIANKALLTKVTNEGFSITIKRCNLVSPELKCNVGLSPIEGKQISLTIEQMDLNLSGYIVKTYMLGGGNSSMDISFSREYSDYFKDCLFDLIPSI